jgi:NADH dehydrogenase [ubiquinone] 1 alpha subcomplex assembly factor 6
MSLTYCGNLVRQHEPDRFLLTLFERPSVRPALWALYALNWEISRTRYMVTDTRLGHIRLQWWRDEIGKVYDGGGGGNIPTLSTLAPLIHEGRLPRVHFEEILYAREFDLEGVAPASLEGLRNYMGFIETPLAKLALTVLNQNVDLAQVVDISIFFSLVRNMRNVPIQLKYGICLLPEDLLRAEGVSPKKVIDFNHQKEVIKAISGIFSLTESYRKPKNAFLSRMLKISNIYLQQMKENKFDVFSSKMRVLPPFLALRLLWP